jgi:DNA-directed RNA polymerase
LQWIAALWYFACIHISSYSRFIYDTFFHVPAALGRDEWGGAQVNLVDSEKPQDVYSGVCSVVQQKLKADAEKGDELAKLLIGKVERKTVKQVLPDMRIIHQIVELFQMLSRLSVSRLS